MTIAPPNPAVLQQRLEEAVDKHKVVGASLAVLSGDEIHEAAAGTANLATGTAVTSDTVFLIGSNSKVFTATLVMQLVDEGLVDLDATVRTYLPGLRLADEATAAAVTVRHLLTHTSGIEGDWFRDFGRGDDACERYVASLAEVGQVHPLGELWSYCNSGWVVLGRLIEVLRGASWSSVVRERLLKPAGLDMTLTPEEAILRRHAVGHVPTRDTGPNVTPSYLLPHALAAAGSVISSTAADLLRFVRLHLDGGASQDGTRVLSEDSVRAMQQAYFERPLVAGNAPGRQGLGWMLAEHSGERILMHGGGTTGQRSFLEVAPDRRFGLALLTNGPVAETLWLELAGELFAEHVGIERPKPLAAPETPPQLDLSRYAGTYENVVAVLTLELRDGELIGSAKARNVPDAEQEQAPQPDQPREVALRPIDDAHFLLGGQVLTFQGFGDDGRPGYVSMGRVLRRTS